MNATLKIIVYFFSQGNGHTRRVDKSYHARMVRMPSTINYGLPSL